MKDAIKEYLPLTDEEKRKLWDSAIFVFDTNVFFNLYRYSKKTRDALLSAMKELRERIWIPYQVAYEFMRKRPKVIFDSEQRYSSLEKDILRPCKEQLRIKDDDPEFSELQRYVRKWIEKTKKNNHLVESPSDDPILTEILELFDGRAGSPYSPEVLEDIKKEGATRYKKHVPPGYKDASKGDSVDDNNAYGDLIVWKQIMDYASSNNTNIIFVTHDQKEDWWRIVQGKTLGPREELRREFAESTKMCFYMYSMDSFITQYQTIKADVVDSSIVDEVKSYTIPPATMNICQHRESEEWSHLFGDTLSIHDISDFEKAIESVITKKKRRELELESIYHKYSGKQMPLSVQNIVHNLRKNIRHDERLIHELMRRRHYVVHAFGPIPT